MLRDDVFKRDGIALKKLHGEYLRVYARPAH